MTSSSTASTPTTSLSLVSEMLLQPSCAGAELTLQNDLGSFEIACGTSALMVLSRRQGLAHMSDSSERRLVVDVLQSTWRTRAFCSWEVVTLDVFKNLSGTRQVPLTASLTARLWEFEDIPFTPFRTCSRSQPSIGWSRVCYQHVLSLSRTASPVPARASWLSTCLSRWRAALRGAVWLFRQAASSTAHSRGTRGGSRSGR